MDFPKKQAQRLMPLYLLDYATQLQISHPDPTESWGGGSGGSTYTAGDGINISSENVISVDDTIAKKSDIPSRVKSPFLGVRQTTDGTVLFSETGEDNDYYSVYHVIEPVRVNLRALNPKFGSGLTSSYNTSTRALDIAVDTTIVALKSEIPTKTSELTNDSDFITSTALTNYVTTTQLDNKLVDYALKTDIPSLDGYATQTWVQNQGYSTFSGSYNDLTDKPTLATVATSGSYNDLTDKPTIPDTTNLVTTNTDQTISGFKTFNNGLKWGMLGGAYTLQTIPVGWRFKFNDPQNPQQIDFSLPIEKSGTEYTIATKDDIPTSATSTSTLTPTTETLVFTLSDGSTYSLNVMTSATVSTTTTLS